VSSSGDGELIMTVACGDMCWRTCQDRSGSDSKRLGLSLEPVGVEATLKGQQEREGQRTVNSDVKSHGVSDVTTTI
jgi:hypothetical protein